MDGEPAPYPPERKGERFRWLPFPCERPEPSPDRLMGRDRYGRPYSIRRSLGLPSTDPPDDDGGVPWTDWPP